ncbi:hypothetical protein IACHDJAJ_00072 [Aeromonas phage vB_AdhS_TS3]|nr:hypothetical protein IACHDJAJ_00072 [Aeromonas phage vB_AdhS_TS3]
MYSIYTDGACRGNPGPASWAFVVYNDKDSEVGFKRGSEDLSTNNAMELEAILQALVHISKNVEKYVGVGGVTIYTDSAFCVNVITQWMDGWQANGWKKKSPGPIKNLEIIQKLHKYWHICGKGVGNVQIAKVAGHSGIKGNERADELCNNVLDESK